MLGQRIEPTTPNSESSPLTIALTRQQRRYHRFETSMILEKSITIHNNILLHYTPYYTHTTHYNLTPFHEDYVVNDRSNEKRKNPATPNSN